MAIQNRENALSQQREVLSARLSAVATGESYVVCVVPFPCALQAAHVGAYGLSGSPQLMLRAHRFTSAGATSIDLGVSNMVVSVANGVSTSSQGWSGIRALGSTLLNLQAGDAIVLGTAGANTALRELAVTLVVQKSQDIVQHFNLAT